MRGDAKTLKGSKTSTGKFSNFAPGVDIPPGMAQTTTEDRAESYQPIGKPQSVDRDKGIVYGVLVCGLTSRNGGKYPIPVFENSVGHYEGKNVYVDLGQHQREQGTNIPAPVKFGTLRKARVTAEGLRADLHYNPENAFTKEFLWAVDNDPTFYGLSHVARVHWKNNPDGSRTAESISNVVRVEIVGDPATATSVFESKGTHKVETDPRTIASTITSPDALKTFLASLFDGLPSGSFTNEAKSACLNELMTKYGDAPADPAADPNAAVESLKAYGRVGKWAGDFIAESMAATAKADRIKKAGELCDAEKLPAHLKTATFVEQVAESLADPAKAKALIVDRVAIGKPTAESVKDGNTETRTTERKTGDPAPTKVGDIVSAYAAGKRFAPSKN